jgi:signal peptidase I
VTGYHNPCIAAARHALVADVLRRFGRVQVRATGNSMRPAIRPGDILLIVRCPLQRIEPGDVVVFARDARLFAHRLIEKCAGPDGSSMVTRGDSNWDMDLPVTVDQLLGKVIAVERRNTSSSPSRPSPLRRAQGLVIGDCIGAVRWARTLMR